MQKANKKGFTLLELLIVIGILAVLASTAVIVLNPAELLRQARDTQRVSDLGSLKSAIALYVTSFTTPTLQGGGSNCAANCWVSNASVAVGGVEDDDGCGQVNSVKRHGTKEGDATHTTLRAIDGTGWVPVILSNIAGGSPLPSLPIDPNDSATAYYSYACNEAAVTFEFNAVLESTKYNRDLDLDFKDGGNNNGTAGGPPDGAYEVGTEPGLDI